ncbi:MAG: transcriptional repressor [Armatimonadetes bacterium]|nr:transcriptional repressor [Armatimonadota bacterium]
MSKHDNQAALVSTLAAKGVRLTKQRRILLDLIEHTEGHLHASDLLRLAREEDERMDRATVYRTLSLLKTLGLVEELDLLHLDGNEHHYELRDQRDHVHIGCTKCGKIIEFQSELVRRLEVDIRRETGCTVEFVRIEVAAICSECRRKL